MKETIAAIAGTLFFLVSIGQIDPNMTIGEFVGQYYEPIFVEEEVPESEEELPLIVIEDPVVPEVTLTVEEPIMPEVTSYTDADARAIAEVMHAEAKGLSDAEKRAVGWCVLNRVDDWGCSIQGAVSQEGAFVRSSYYSDEELALANGLLLDWASNCGLRELPSGYYYFNGDGKQNHFRTSLSSKERFTVSVGAI